MIRARIDYACLADATSSEQAQSAQLRIAQQLAHNLEAIFVRRRDGTYYLRAGIIQGEIPIGQVVWPEKYDPAAIEAFAHTWLTALADALQAVFLYNGKQGKWYLVWPDVQEAEEKGAVGGAVEESSSGEGGEGSIDVGLEQVAMQEGAEGGMPAGT